MKKMSHKKRDLEKKLLLKSETLRDLDLKGVTAGGESELGCMTLVSCAKASCDPCTCTWTFPPGAG